MFLCFKELAIVSSLKHKNTQPLYIFNRENPQNSEPQNCPRRGLDFIALIACTVWFVQNRSTNSCRQRHNVSNEKIQKNLWYLSCKRNFVCNRHPCKLTSNKKITAKILESVGKM